MTRETPKTIQATVGKLSLADLLFVACETGAAIGLCFATHMWLAG